MIACDRAQRPCECSCPYRSTWKRASRKSARRTAAFRDQWRDGNAISASSTGPPRPIGPPRRNGPRAGATPSASSWTPASRPPSPSVRSSSISTTTPSFPSADRPDTRPRSASRCRWAGRRSGRRSCEPRFSITLSTGEPTGEEDLLIPLQRSGYLEETYITFSFAALRDDRDLPNGIFCTAYETTARVIADRQLNCLRALAAQSAFAETPEDACQAAATTPGRQSARSAVRAVVSDRGRPGTPVRNQRPGERSRERAADDRPGRGHDAWRSRSLVEPRRSALSTMCNPCRRRIRTPEVTPDRAFALPICGSGGERPAGVLIAGANPMRPLEESAGLSRADRQPTGDLDLQRPREATRARARARARRSRSRQDAVLQQHQPRVAHSRSRCCSGRSTTC